MPDVSLQENVRDVFEIFEELIELVAHRGRKLRSDSKILKAVRQHFGDDSIRSRDIEDALDAAKGFADLILNTAMPID